MHLARISKYFALVKIGMNLAQKGMEWAEKARSDDSPGGKKITPEECLDLIPIIEETIADGLGVMVNVRVEPSPDMGA